MNDEIIGIVISFREYRENDALLHVLGEDDRIYTVSARGVQKVKSKNAAAVQLFTKSRFLLHLREQSEIQGLKSAEIIESYRQIREDLYKQSIASYMCEVMDASMFEWESYALLDECLTVLKQSEDPLTILCLFQSIINRMHGIEPYVDGCVRCHTTKQIAGISTVSGGFVCQSCMTYKDVKKTSNALKIFRMFCKGEMQHYALIDQTMSYTFDDFLSLYDFFAEYAGVSLKSIRFLKHLYGMRENSK